MALPVVTKNLENHSSGAASTLSIASYVSDSNPLLLVVWMLSTTAAVSTITVPTFNGVSLFKVATGVSGSWSWELWGLDAPANTTAALSVTLNASVVFGIAGFSYSGGAAPSALGSDCLVVSSATSTAASVSISGRGTTDLMLAICANATTSQTFTAGGGQTATFTTDTGATTNAHAASSSKAGIAGSTSMTYTLGTSGAWGMAGLNLPDATVASGQRTTQAPVVVGGAGAQAHITTQAPVVVASAGTQSAQTTQVVALVATPTGTASEQTTQVVAGLVSAGPGGEAQQRTTQVAVLIGRAPKVTDLTLTGSYSGTSVYGSSSGSGPFTVQR